MLTQNAARLRLNMIAEEVSQLPGMYYELYARAYSARVQRLLEELPAAEAAVIRRIVENDPDYCPDIVPADFEADAALAQTEPAVVELLVASRVSTGMLFNPAWDVQY